MYLFSSFYNHKITQHFFFFTKRKPVLKEKQICSFGKAFLSKKRFLVESRGYLYKIFLLFLRWNNKIKKNKEEKKKTSFFSRFYFFKRLLFDYTLMLSCVSTFAVELYVHPSLAILSTMKVNVPAALFTESEFNATFPSLPVVS